MNANSGGGGLFIAFFGLFFFLIMACLKLFFYAYVAAVAVVLLIIKGIQLLWLHHRAKRLASRKKIFDSLEPPAVDAPMPVMSRVGPRDWHPPH